MLFLSGCQLCSKCFYTLSRAIKEKKKKEEEVGHSEVQRGKERLVFLSLLFGIGRKTAVARERLVAKEWEEREKEKKRKFLLLLG